MPRPFKQRRVCCRPDSRYFKPRGVPVSLLEEIDLTLDELEAMRLADVERLYQENAASAMNISRQTFGNIITSAHKKVAEALLNTKALKIVDRTSQNRGEFMNEELKAYRSRIRRHKRFGLDVVASRRFILEKSDLAGEKTILEVGTGNGYLAAALLRKGKDIVSIDVDRKAQKNFRQCLKQMGITRKITLKLMSAEKFPYKDGAFDCVISANAVHHFQNPKACLREMVRVAGRKVIISDFNKTGAKRIDRIHKAEGKEGHVMGGMGIREVKVFLKRSGLTVKAYSRKGETLLVAKKGKKR